MNSYFKTEYLESAKKQRKGSLIAYFIVLALFVAALTAGIVIYALLPYGSSYLTTVKLVVYPITAVFIIFSFLYLGIVNKRVSRYYALLKRLSVGIRETSVAEFKGYSDVLYTKDGVDMKALLFTEWNKYKKEYYERKVGVFFEKDFPALKEGATYEFITVGNVLIEYEEKEMQK